MVKTLDGTATCPKKYEKVEELVKMTKTQQEHIVKVPIVDDDEYNEDCDFYVEICNEDGVKLEGDDCSTRITIKDEDKPGEIGFEKKKYQVRRMDKYAYVQLVRREGSTGDAQCYCKTEQLTSKVNNQAEEYNDFLPFNDPVIFKNGEIEQVIKVQIFSQDEKVNNGEEGETQKKAEDEKDKSKDDGEEEQEQQTLVF